MRTSDLETKGIPPAVIRRWVEDQGEVLLPIQRAAIRGGLLGRRGEDRQNMIISAPTSSGKSFCADMASMLALTERRKVIFLFPLKSLAEQVYHRMCQWYQPLGIDLLIATADHPENDRRFLAADFQIAISIYEKCDVLMANNLDMLSSVGLIVVDELQMLGDESRGLVLERLLTRIIASCYTPRLLALSAVLDEKSLERLAGWMSATVVSEHTRPVDLFRGVAANGILKLQSFNSLEESDEPFASLTDSGDQPSDFLVEQLKKSGSPTIVFLKSRQDTVRFAFRLAASSSWEAAKEALKELKGEEQSSLVRSLIQTLGRGVAFHSADLTRHQQEIVEQSFISGAIRVLCSTTTLALGVNLPATTVYLETVRFTSGTYDHRPQLIPISRAEFDNMTGRAGRFGFSDNMPGRAIVVTETEFDRDILWQQYLEPAQPEPLSLPILDESAMRNRILHMICCGLVKDKQTAQVVAGKSFRAYQQHEQALPVDNAIEQLVALGLVLRSAQGMLQPSACGRAVAANGLSVKEAMYYRSSLHNRHPGSPFGWVVLALSSPSWELPSSILTRLEQNENLVLRQFYQRFEESTQEIACLVGDDAQALRRPLTYRHAATLKGALLIDDWRRMAPVQQLEEQYQMHLGQIVSLGETTAHLLSAMAAILVADEEISSAEAEQLKELAFSVRFGLSSELIDMHHATAGILRRSDFLKLYQADIQSVVDLKQLSHEEQLTLLGDKSRLEALQKIITESEEENVMARIDRATLWVDGVEPESVEIVGTQDRERFLVRIDGFPVPLTGKSFKYFTKLAWSRQHRDTGWLFKEDIEIGFNQARYLYRMKNEIASELNSNWPIVENNRLGYYRLRIDPNKIHLNLETLKNHPDWEIRQLFERESTSASVN